MEQIDSSSKPSVNSIFVYGTLRPDNEWLEAWAKEEIDKMEVKRAIVKGMQLYGGDLAVAKFLDYKDPKAVIHGWLLSHQNE